MAVIITFLLGIGNFAVHKAVLDSRHPIIAHMPRFLRLLGGKASLGVEFVLLAGWGWAYFGYSVLNGLAGWLILSRRL